MKTVNCSQIARIGECAGGLRWRRVTSIWPRPEEQGAGRDSFVLVRAERADTKHLDSLGNAIGKCSHACGVIEDPSLEECRNVAILGKTAEDRHILRGGVAVEQQLVARGKELCNASNHFLFVIAEFLVIGERIPGSQPIKTQAAVGCRLKNDLRRPFRTLTDNLQVAGRKEILDPSSQELLIQPIQDWFATFLECG